MFWCVTHPPSCEKRNRLSNGCGHNPESRSLGLTPRRGAQLLLGASEESKGEMRSFFSAQEPVNYSPSSSYSSLSTYWVIKKPIFSSPYFRFSDSPSWVLGRAICSFLVLYFTVGDKLVNKLIQRSVSKKTRRQRNIASSPS